jgi:hypothetical protein
MATGSTAAGYPTTTGSTTAAPGAPTSIDAVTVAEGIEDLEDLMTLRDLGVRFGQGYYLARPDFGFPEVSKEAAAAIRAKPQRTRPAATPEEGAGNGLALKAGVVSSLALEDDSTGRMLTTELARAPSEGLARGKTMAGHKSSSDDDFEDEPTRTRGDIN